MTHSLHRYRIGDEKSDDYVFLVMAAQGKNSEGAAPKLAAMYKILASAGADNYGEDNQGGVFTGVTDEEILANIKTTAYPGGAFSDIEKVKETLRRMKDADTGMCVVLTGDFEEVFTALAEVGLKPHTVNMSLGIFGNVNCLPEEEILEISTMCGHSMVCPDHVRHVMNLVEKGSMTARDAALDLARPCTCAIFNPRRAEYLINKHCHKNQEVC